MDKRKEKGYNPKRTGEKSLAQVMALFVLHEMRVLTPFGDSDRYDIITDEDEKFVRVQCKTGRIQNEGKVFIFDAHSNNWYSGGKKNYKGQADVFAVYVPEIRNVYIFNINNCPVSEVRVRLKEPENGQKKGIRRAKDHLFVPARSLLSYP